MRLKYKKIILLVSMSCMGIGFVTFSIGNTSDKKKATGNVAIEEGVDTQNPGIEPQTGLKIVEGLVDDGTLLENAYPQINTLVEKYLDARLACDMDTIEKVVSNTHQITKEALQKESEYIESYNNLICYTIKAPDNESYVVYVYEEIKILGVDTLAPGMTRLYVRLNDEGNPIVYFGQVEDATLDFINDSSNTPEVIQLIDGVNKRLEEAMTKDKSLYNFIVGLENVANSGNETSESTDSGVDQPADGLIDNSDNNQ